MLSFLQEIRKHILVKTIKRKDFNFIFRFFGLRFIKDIKLVENTERIITAFIAIKSINKDNQLNLYI